MSIEMSEVKLHCTGGRSGFGRPQSLVCHSGVVATRRVIFTLRPESDLV